MVSKRGNISVMHFFISYTFINLFYITNYFTTIDEMHNHNIRNREQFSVLFAYSTNTRHFTIRYFGPHIWTSLPTALIYTNLE